MRSNNSDDDRRAINYPPGPSFKFRHELRPPADPNKLPVLPYYDRHPEHRPRPLSKRQTAPARNPWRLKLSEGDERPPRIVGEFVEYSDFVQVVRNRVADLGIHGTRFDALAGMPEGYLSKLIGPRPVRRISHTSMGPLLSAMGVKLVMVEDPSGTARLRALPPRNSSFVRTMPADACIVLTPRMLKRIRRMGGKARMAKLTPEQRSELGRLAANVRWRKASP